jgi:hypothetical protein
MNLVNRLRTRLAGDDRPGPGDGQGVGGHGQRLGTRVAALEEAVEENRRLNQRLADVIDVVCELLVPAVDRDDDRLREALANLNKTLDDGPRG